MKYFRYNLFKFNDRLGWFLILLFGIPRFIVVLEANRTANYNFTSIIFLVMWFTPFLLLNKSGRKLIGIEKSKNYAWLANSLLLGILASTLVYFIGVWLYQMSDSHWFVYISRSYGSIPVEALSGNSKPVYFALFAIIGMTFSPIGEELLYRGLIHQSFVSKYGGNKASIIDSLAFAIVHLAHFGIVYLNGSWQILVIPGLIWMLLMFLTSRVFFYCKRRTGSIYGAILSHAGFNLAMTYFIFYWIL